MKKRAVISWAVVILPMILLAVVAINQARVQPATVRAENGELDLRDIAFDAGTNVWLDGEWKFYWKQFLDPAEALPPAEEAQNRIAVPSIWNGHIYDNEKLNGDGYGTYAMRVHIRDTNALYAIKLVTMSNAYRIYVDNALLGSNGKVGETKESYSPEYRSQIVAFKPESEWVDIVIHVSNFYHYKGGIWHPLRFGEYSSVIRENSSGIFWQVFIFGCLFIMAIYHFGLFSLRAKDKSVLFFGLVCLIIGVRSLFTGENLITYVAPNADWFISRKIEFILTFISVPVYATFARELYPKEWHKWMYYLLLGFGIALVLFTLCTPVKVYTFGSFVFTFYSGIASLYLLYTFIIAALRRREGANLFLATSLLFMLSIVNEILNQNEVVHTGLFLPVGLLIVVFAQAYIISLRTANAYRTIELYADTFQKFVPLQFLNRIAKEGLESIKPGNAERGEFTVLFSDIRSFTTISEKLTPSEVFHMLNEYLAYVEPPIRRQKGFVDKYMGDGIMALFEKTGEESSANNAIMAALEMQSALQEYNTIRKSQGKEALEMGLGIHTGHIIIGTLGGNERMDSTAIGDAVNLCSRIEGMTKMYGTGILVSGYALSSLEEKTKYLMRFVDHVVVKGKTEPVAIWEILGLYTDARIEKMQRLVREFEKGLVHYRDANYTAAIHSFEDCLAIHPDDKVSAIYLERSHKFLANPDQNNGVTFLDEK